MPMRIIIVEDDPSQLDLLSHWTTAAGHQAIIFECGDDFLKTIGQEQFDMLILDWNLPDATGIDILRHVRQTSKVPVLFCTARVDQNDAVRALQEGADDYLIKPLRPSRAISTD
jgi:DNA-binding response OmpR family regulator